MERGDPAGRVVCFQCYPIVTQLQKGVLRVPPTMFEGHHKRRRVLLCLGQTGDDRSVGARLASQQQLSAPGGMQKAKQYVTGPSSMQEQLQTRTHTCMYS